MSVEPNNEQMPEKEPTAPPRLKVAFQSMKLEEPFVPPSVDAAILCAARQHLGGKQPPKRWLSLWPRIAVACGAMMIAVTLWLVRTPAFESTRAVHDFNGDGAVDILDALALAEQLPGGGGGRDVNDDGVVNEGDVEALGLMIVRLDKEARS